ncbi:MAG: alpha/beta fold hydrolase [Candidatus Binataceae bacterium]
MEHPESKFVTVNGLRLHYLDFGAPANPALVCIHGLTGNAHDFDSLAPHLARTYHLISLDVRGRGLSEWGPPEQYNIPVYAKDLVAFLDQLGIERMNLIGTSMGGRIAILYAGTHPGRVERLVLNDIGPALEPSASGSINQTVSGAPMEFSSLDEVIAYYRRVQFGQRIDAAFVERLKWSMKDAGGGKLTWRMDPAIRKPPPGLNPVRQIEFWAEYQKIEIPILILRGAESAILGPKMSARMCEVSRHARLVEVPGVGHPPSLAEPEALDALREFFSV